MISVPGQVDINRNQKVLNRCACGMYFPGYLSRFQFLQRFSARNICHGAQGIADYLRSYKHISVLLVKHLLEIPEAESITLHSFFRNCECCFCLSICCCLVFLVQKSVYATGDESEHNDAG